MKSAPEFILVGVDGTPESQLALRWAIQAAAARGTAVRIVRAYLDQVAQWPAIGAEGFIPQSQADRYQAELDADVDIVRDRLGYQNGSGWLANYPAADAILTEAPEAELVVLGSRVSTKLGAAVLGSVATAVTAKAPCPVVVVRGTPADGPILVGTDGSEDSDAAVQFGFEEAQRTRSDLQVVYCWQPLGRNEVSIDDAEELLKDWLAESLAPYRDKFPGVRVRAEVVAGRAAAVLAERSSGCSMVVVGSRGRGGVRGLLLGSVSQNLLHHANCPIAVVRPPREQR
ncbi:nucleotide-binding universal stress UspA family protein [Kribbella voronezhensis]|uniref:Nucleotide-binding universal stress UspA family protein n=1 Tax=Kribbella voronezhensis TaxID=2512212 RepID=A0A4R7SY29_9ACTN|nr:universal stress protein [Kribbella voronezhensis]TDU83829.1 nucleotide-binding universal stress UspA family protein [Kribbella voronezhensis]